jgi:tetratricopeptide (TPR) repeat protein
VDADQVAKDKAMKNVPQTYLKQFLLRLSALLALMPCLVVNAQQPSSGSANAMPPVFGELKPGPYAVGFRIIHLKDTTRLVQPKRDYLGALNTGDRARQLNLHVWYPAEEASGAPMTFEQYIYHSDFGALNDATRREQRDFARRFLFAGRFSDAVWQTLLDSPMLARRNAREAAGKFPLLLGELRPLSTSITTEYLASHGYVVVMIEGAKFQTDVSAAVSKEDAYRNFEFAYAHTRTMLNVDQNILGTLGFSAFGVTQLIYAMRTREVDAVVCLESGFFHDRNFYQSAKETPGYEVTALRAPMLHMFRLGKEHPASLGDFEAMRYATRYHYQVEAPQIRHADFSTEGMAEVTVLGLRPAAAAQLRKAFELTNLYVLNFLNAHLKDDAAGLAFLRRDPVKNNAPEKMITITEKAGIKAAPSEAEFLSLIQSRGLDQALALFKEAKKTDPDAALFREAGLIKIGSQLGSSQRYKEAIEIYKLCLEVYPKSSQTAFNLAFAYEAAGEKKSALEFFERSLQLVESDPNQTESERQFIKNTAPRRISALKAEQSN